MTTTRGVVPATRSDGTGDRSGRFPWWVVVLAEFAGARVITTATMLFLIASIVGQFLWLYVLWRVGDSPLPT
ncbi:hypothetical protein [Labedella populi]|uniref:hypothetical protein n=1 Tax=Labedella populi TaxID=2498850 RepID=UPI00140DDC3D|nr:hypothetical protein [Labedella populi]